VAGQISAQDEIRCEHRAGDHQAEGRYGPGPKRDMQERNHAKQYSVIEWRGQRVERQANCKMMVT